MLLPLTAPPLTTPTPPIPVKKSKTINTLTYEFELISLLYQTLLTLATHTSVSLISTSSSTITSRERWRGGRVNERSVGRVRVGRVSGGGVWVGGISDERRVGSVRVGGGGEREGRV